MLSNSKSPDLTNLRAAMLWKDNKMEEYKRLVMGRYNLKSD